MPLSIRNDVPLAPLTTLELGGPARFFAEVRTEADLVEAFGWAEKRGVKVAILGGGSNLVVRDEGFDGLVVRIGLRGTRFEAGADAVLVTVAAGDSWDGFVEAMVVGGLGGLECLSGIPGRMGATPVQNVGAYGQDVSETITSVRVYDRRRRRLDTLAPSALAFGYRDSALKRDPERAVVLAVTFRFVRGAAPKLAYAELVQAMEGRERTLEVVRETVLGLRRKKSMVLDPADPNRRSAGSFFTNPLVSPAVAQDVARRALARGCVTAAEQVPQWNEPDGRIKLAAGWLIERAGITKGMRRGPVGISTAHALALVHHGGGTSRELLALEAEVRNAVASTWGIELVREPVLW